ncbi:MAG: hypothetical protein KBC91_05780 [Candidatus Omnitrophica bacterium]|nr:hypothetical protein [Candidatus Omnitrophota bacterium]
MKRFIFNPKLAAGVILVSLVFFAAAHEAKSALIDWAKHEEWRRKQLTALVTEVNLKGSAPYVIMSFSNYDTNKDGVIDRNEVEAIKTLLSQAPAARPNQ